MKKGGLYEICKKKHVNEKREPVRKDVKKKNLQMKKGAYKKHAKNM